MKKSYLILLSLIFIFILFVGCGEQTLPPGPDPNPEEFTEINVTYPDSGTTVNDFRAYLDWSGVEEANCYRVQLFKDGELLIDQIELQSSFKTLTPLFPGEYSFTVGVRFDTLDFGYWSDTIPFTLVQSPYTLESTTYTPGMSNDLIRFGDAIYVADETHGLTVVDYNGGNPIYSESYTYSSRQDKAKKVWVDPVSNSLFMANYRSATYIGYFDISSPFEPITQPSSFWVRPCADIYGLYYNDTLYILASDRDEGLSLAPVTDQAFASTYAVDGDNEGLGVLADTIGALCSGDLGVTLVDIRDQTDLEYVTTWDTPGDATEIVFDEEQNLAYIADGLAGLTVIDFSDGLENPQIIGRADTQVGDAKDVELVDNRVYVAASSKGVLVYDVSIPSAPYLIQQIETMSAEGVYVDSDHRVYIADRDWGVVIAK